MNVEQFADDRAPAGGELDELVGRARRRPERLGADRIRALGELYRGTAADLAFARRQFPGDPVTLALEQRVARAHDAVYDAPTRRESVLDWFSRGYWRALRERALLIALAAVLLAGSAGLAGVWAYRDPGAAGGLAPSAYNGVTQPRPHGANLGLSTAERTAFASQIFTNNIRVTLLVFAAGLLLGIGSAAVLIWNGVQLGVVAGLAAGSGNGGLLVQLVAPHGMLELSCIVVTSAAAMRMGWSLVEPGRRTRAQAVGQEAREAIKIVLSTAPWLVVAGLIEGLLTPTGLGVPAALAVGAAAAGVFWLLALTRSRRALSP